MTSAHFVQFHTDQQDRFALIAQGNQLLVNKLNRADIDTARGLPDQQQIGVALHLSGQNDLLLVAARKAFGRLPAIRRADVKAFDLAFGVFTQGFVVH